MVRFLAALFASVFVSAAAAENWPSWRGANQGVSAEKNLPVRWGPKHNIRWKVKLPGPGNSTPIVWGDRVFLTQADDFKQWPPKVPANYAGGASAGGHAIAEKRSLLCFRRTDGELLWRRDVLHKDAEITHPTNPFCSASPVTDGRLVVASHGAAGLVCCDVNGNELWRYDVGKLEHLWGNASSPILHSDLCIHWSGPGEHQYLLALDKRTGKKVWETPMPGGDPGITSKRFLGSWSTPAVVRVDGKDQVLFAVPGKVLGFDLRDGKELWSAKGPGSYCYHSPLHVNGLAIFGSTLYRLGGAGDITKSRLGHQVGAMYISTAVIGGEHLYTYNNVGVFECWEWKTGKKLWRDQVAERPGGGEAWGSPILADGRVYIADRRGNTTVVAAGPKYEVLALNRLDEPCNASLAVSQGNLFLRTYKHLWCIGKGK